MGNLTGALTAALAPSGRQGGAWHSRLVFEASAALLGLSILLLDRPTLVHYVYVSFALRILVVLVLALVVGMCRGDVRLAIVGAVTGIVLADLMWIPIPLAFFGHIPQVIVASPFALIGALVGAITALKNGGAGVLTGFSTSIVGVVLLVVLTMLSLDPHPRSPLQYEGVTPFLIFASVGIIVIGVVVSVCTAMAASVVTQWLGIKSPTNGISNNDLSNGPERAGYWPHWIVLPITLFIIYWTAFARMAFPKAAWSVAAVLIIATWIAGVLARRGSIQRRNRRRAHDATATGDQSRGNRWISLSRGATLAAVIVVSLYLGWWTRPAFLSSRTRLAVNAIRNAGGQVHDQGMTQEVYVPYRPGTDHITDARLRSISYVSFFGGSAHDGDLALLKDLPALATIQLDGPSFTDAGIVHLAGVKSLKALWATHTQITGRGLNAIRGLNNLETLYLADSPIDDAGLSDICFLKSLKLLNLEETRVSDAGLDALKSLDRCERIQLAGTNVGDGVVQLVENMPKLLGITLYQTRVTKQGMEKVNRILAARKKPPLQPPAAP